MCGNVTSIHGIMGIMSTAPKQIRRRWYRSRLGAILLAIAGQSFTAGCGPNWPVKNRSLSDYTAVMHSARTALPIAVEVEELYPNADHFITHFGFNASPKKWNTVTSFGDRYVLHMVVEVTIDYEKRTLKQLGDPTFSIIEYTKIDKLRGGGMEASSPNTSYFGAKEWEKLYKSRGDLSTVNVKLNPEPVPGFTEFTAGYKRDRIPISLLDR
jgi:hypothetical protein